MPRILRPRRSLHISVTLNVVLMALNVALMVCWIVLLAQSSSWPALTIGTVLFSLILVGLIVYLVLTVKEIRLNERQANFIGSVTHELKSPIASLKLFLETLQLREVPADQRQKLYRFMTDDLHRLDGLISQLLEVGWLDAIVTSSAGEEVDLESVLRKCASTACIHYNVNPKNVSFDLAPAVVRGGSIATEMIFRNLLDNAFKYSGGDPKVEIQVAMKGQNRVVTRISDNGVGVPREIRKKIFGLFYRGGNELERKQKGTGLGLYIVQTLVRRMKGRVSVQDRRFEGGAVFEVELPGRAAECESPLDDQQAGSEQRVELPGRAGTCVS